MELYIDDDEVASPAKVADLENALAAVKALDGKKDLCLQAGEGGEQMILTVIPGGWLSPRRYCIEQIQGRCIAQLFSRDWKTAADCMRRALAGRLPFPGAMTGDGCPLCKLERGRAENG